MKKPWIYKSGKDGLWHMSYKAHNASFDSWWTAIDSALFAVAMDAMIGQMDRK